MPRAPALGKFLDVIPIKNEKRGGGPSWSLTRTSVKPRTEGGPDSWKESGVVLGAADLVALPGVLGTSAWAGT